jgi:hypothetical protein
MVKQIKGHSCVGQMSVDKMSVDPMSVDKMSVDQISVDQSQMIRCLNQMFVDQICLTKYFSA